MTELGVITDKATLVALLTLRLPFFRDKRTCSLMHSCPAKSKIGEVGSPKILPLGVLPVAFLTICFHSVDVFLGIVAHTWVAVIGANYNVFTVLELRPRVGTAAAVACKETPTASPTILGIGGPVVEWPLPEA